MWDLLSCVWWLRSGGFGELWSCPGGNGTSGAEAAGASLESQLWRQECPWDPLGMLGWGDLAQGHTRSRGCIQSGATKRPFPPCQDPDVKIPEIRAERSNPGAQEVALESVSAVSGSHLALVFGLGGRTGACPAPAALLDPPFSSPPSHSCWELSVGVLLLLHVQGFAPDRCSTASDLPSPAFSLYKTGRCQN